MNALERAVIEAARLWRHDLSEEASEKLLDALDALDAADDPAEIPWHQVAVGDQVKSIKNGKFYPVLGVIALSGGKRQITLDLAGSPRSVVRPTEEEPIAVVRRGADGRAVDLFVDVFSSGGA